MVQRAEMLAVAERPWSPAPRPAASLLLEPPPNLVALANPPERDPAMVLIEQAQHKQAMLNARRDTERGWKRDSDRLLQEFHAQEVESWKDTPAIVSQQSEPLLLEEVLRLNIPENSSISPDLQRILLSTKSDLPLTINDQVLRYVNYFLGRGHTTLREALRRAGSYRPMISRILAEEGVPQDLIYLVQAESGFRPRARSRKQATGMWQFVAWRGREYGLNQNRHVDERLDPEKATQAAARHLADLHAQFGNWYLAMAAYNCGPGCVQRAVERSGYADYWEMAHRGVLPRETANYVPVILAMALLDKNAEAFHLDGIVPEQPIDYDTVQTRQRISLNLIADATGATLARIKQLNPALLGQATPDGPYALRIPKDTAGQFEEEIAQIPEIRRQSWRRHEVRSGETLPQIAARYRVKAAEIAQVNHLDAERLAPGQRITVPAPFRPEVQRAATARSGGIASRTHLVRYRVRSGDSLGSIARRYRVSIAQLQRWNGLSRTQVEAGQVLSVHVTGAGQSSHPRAAAVSKTAHTYKHRAALEPPALPPGRTALAQP
jgi:membrane-bound lytic murein transglycosylase D